MSAAEAARAPFVCEKHPATGRGGMIVTNHPLGTAAGTEMLAAGGNAVDAAVGALLALTVVEPMMVGIAGGGLSHVFMADGPHLVVDALAHAPSAIPGDAYEPLSDRPPDGMKARDRRNEIGASAVAVPGNLAGWCDLHARLGTLPFADIIEPAIRHAAHGFRVTEYLANAIGDAAADLALDAEMARVMMPAGAPPAAGDRLVQGDYAESLRLIATEGAAALHGGPLGAALATRMRTSGPDAGWVSEADLAAYRPRDREPVFGDYRGWRIAGPPPPASSGVHIAQMLHMLEAFDVAGLGFGTPDGLHLMAEVIRLGFEDRRRASGDPDFVEVPVEQLISKDYAAECRRGIRRMAHPDNVAAASESADTTHVTVADRAGNIVTATHTINARFGARIMVPGTGIIPNNYMSNFDPNSGRALSIAPGKRVPTSMAPVIAFRDGRPAVALGLPGGVRIFPSALQALVNIVDHGMNLQEAVEAPRIWTEGHELEVERPFASVVPELEARGHDVRVLPHIGGGMNAVALDEDGGMTGAACWRADGTVTALGGGLARPGTSFWPDAAPDDAEETAP